MKRYKQFSDPHVITSREMQASIDRDDAKKAQEVRAVSTSGTLRRCNFCKSWNAPKGKDERCPVCRQKFEAAPLQGLPRAS